MNHRAFGSGPVCKGILLLMMGLYLFGPYYSFREIPGDCTCGCRESADRSCCRLKDPGHGEGSLAPGRCCCCPSPNQGRKISARCPCHRGDQSYAGTFEIIVPRVERAGLLQEAGNNPDFDDGLPLPGYKIPPMKPPPKSYHGVLAS